MEKTQVASPEVRLINNRPMVSTWKLAQDFGKEHKNILRNIDALEIPEDFRRLNFEPSSYKNAQNKDQPCFNLTRDGFTLLAFGFTGPKAMQFKLAYIEAFNKMEAALRPKERERPCALDFQPNPPVDERGNRLRRCELCGNVKRQEEFPFLQMEDHTIRLAHICNACIPHTHSVKKLRERVELLYIVRHPGGVHDTGSIEALSRFSLLLAGVELELDVVQAAIRDQSKVSRNIPALCRAVGELRGHINAVMGKESGK